MHVIIHIYMQIDNRQEKLSRLRTALLELLERLRQILAVALARTPLVKGNVYEIVRRCGNPNCRCTRGRLHSTMVLTWSVQVQYRMLSIHIARQEDLRRNSNV